MNSQQTIEPITRQQHERYSQSGIASDQTYRQKYPYISKWGLKFDGTPRTPLVEDIIFRVDRLQKSYGCSDKELVDGFHHLLEGRVNQ